MISKLAKLSVAAALALAAFPAAAAPFCGAPPRIATLRAAWADPKGAIMIASHRGGHLSAPENSLAAVDEAITAGADFLEIDVRVSSDGVPFIMHDGTVNRTTDGAGAGEAMTYGELRRLRLKGGDTPPPTLLEVLTRTCGRILVDLDMKTERFAPVVAVVESLGMLDQVQLFDSDAGVLLGARRLAPALEVMPRLREGASLETVTAGLPPVRIVHGDPKSLTPAMRQAITAVPARIWANALGEVDAALVTGGPSACEGLRRLREQDVSVIQTDRPALLRASLDRCGLTAR